MTSNNSEQTARAQLRSMRLIATSLLVISAIIYTVSCYMQNRYFYLIYAKAFSEASMVGALADWFAVVALFKHPLGLPIPHTAILPRNQGRIAKQVSLFIENSFLQSYVIANKIRLYHFSVLAHHWLNNSQHREKLSAIASQILSHIINEINPQALSNALIQEVKTQFKGARLGHFIALSMLFLKQQNYHQKILELLIKQIKAWLQEPITKARIENSINEWAKQIKDNKPGIWKKLIYLLKGSTADLMDKWLAQKIIRWTEDYCDAILSDPTHFIRMSLDTRWRHIIYTMETSPQWHKYLERHGRRFLAQPLVIGFINSNWQHLQSWLKQDSVAINSLTRKTLDDLVKTLNGHLMDPKQQRQLDLWLARFSKKLIKQYKSAVATYIESQVKNWESQSLVDRLELSAGKDLQYIRINGTLVGGLVGLLICVVTQFFS